MLELIAEKNKIKYVVRAEKMGGHYEYSATALLSPLPISYIGRAKTMSEAVCRGFNTVMMGVRYIESI